LGDPGLNDGIVQGSDNARVPFLGVAQQRQQAGNVSRPAQLNLGHKAAFPHV
jgi:hypothetical protein